ncbi:MAG TPA: DUF4388 domain-containing protein [Thermoanaerobaculia bacterium]|nr:DUF4388 domain-containing protein [Thermoanaerobaculia bacterium]
MAVCGFLKTMPVPELFQWISQSGKTGTLRVSLPASEHTMSFDQGKLVFCASTNLDQSLGRFLIAQGHLSEEMHREAIRVRDRSEISLGMILMELNMVRELDIRHALGRKAEEQLLELFVSSEGAFRFNPEIPLIDMIPIEIDLTQVILEVTHRLDQAGGTAVH